VHILVLTTTAGFRHDSIPAGIGALTELGEQIGITVAATEDTSALRPRNLTGFAAVVFLNTSGDILTAPERDALTAFVAGGGGLVGVHAASTTEYAWPHYGDLIGARFEQHPDVQPAVVRVEDRHHPATRHLPARWQRVDEWYCFQSNPRSRVRVLLTVDETSYDGAVMGGDHPIAWCHERMGGRVFYTAMGHTVEAYDEPAFREHLAGGLRYATGLPDALGLPDPTGLPHPTGLQAMA
jgi:type 1 glutamine amidotransferase